MIVLFPIYLGSFFMAAQNLLQDALSRYKQETIVSIIDRIAGEKDNLRVDLQHVKFVLRGTKFELNGTFNFNIKHKPSRCSQGGN
jgi:hypothetical protein